MTAEVEKTTPRKAQDGTFLGIDSSSWVSWSAFSAGFTLVSSADKQRAFEHAGWQLAVLLGAIAAFFVAILFIQRHMKFSLLANTYGQPNHLVTDGVFAYSRNPIYVAFFMPILSLAVLSPLASLAAFSLYILGMNLLVIQREERVLENGFGDAYRAYKARTRRWL